MFLVIFNFKNRALVLSLLITIQTVTVGHFTIMNINYDAPLLGNMATRSLPHGVFLPCCTLVMRAARHTKGASFSNLLFQ